MAYIPFPIETEPEDLFQEMVAFLQDALPGWEPHEGNLEVIIMRALAQQGAETRDLAADVPPSIFRSFGSSIALLPPNEAVQASATSTWTMIDDTGYTIEAGTLVLIGEGDEAAAFEVLEQVVVANGDSATEDGEVVLVAVESGAAANDLEGAQLLDPLDFVDAIALENEDGDPVQTSGGADAETDEEYQDRLSTLLQLLSPAPILPRDFALLAQTVPGVERAMAVDGFTLEEITTDEIQRMSVNATAGSTYKLEFDGETTAADIEHPVYAVDIQAALESLSNIAPGDVEVVDESPDEPDTPGPPPLIARHYIVRFAETYADTNVPEITFDDVVFFETGGTTEVTTRQQGGVTSVGDGRTVVIACIDDEGEAVSVTVQEDVRTLLESLREINFLVLIQAPNYTEVDVDFAAVCSSDFDPADVRERAIAAVEDYLSPANWGQPASGDQRAWERVTTVRYLEMAEVLNLVQGLDYLTSLEVDGDTIDVELTGDAPLTRPGEITGVVVAP